MGWLIKLRICFWVQKMLHNTNISCQIRRSKEQPNQTLLMFKMKKKKKSVKGSLKPIQRHFYKLYFVIIQKKKKRSNKLEEFS